MAAGDSLARLVCLSVALGPSAGDFLSYADKTAFQADGWDLIAYDVDGVELASQPTWAIAVVDETNGAHRIKWTEPSGIGYILLTRTNEYYRADPYGWAFNGETYTTDDIMGLLLTNQGIPVVSSAADGDLGDVVEGDSYESSAQVLTLSKLARFGYAYADLSDPAFEFSAAFKHQPSDEPTEITFTPGASIAVDGAFSIGWVTMDDDMMLDEASEETSKLFYIDVQVRNTDDDIIITTNRYVINVVWQRDETEIAP
jgi:hypothetical protein